MSVSISCNDKENARRKRNLLPALLCHVSECVKQGGIRHARIIGIKSDELSYERWRHDGVFFKIIGGCEEKRGGTEEK
jgi:hypothetical protein